MLRLFEPPFAVFLAISILLFVGSFRLSWAPLKVGCLAVDSLGILVIVHEREIAVIAVSTVYVAIDAA